MIVVDASVFVHVILAASTADAIVRRLEQHNELLCASHVDLEVLNALRKLVLRGELETPRAEDALKVFFDLPIQRIEPGPYQDLWNMRDNFTPYDAAYVLIARGSNVPLITRDAKLHRACQSVVTCELV
jgi:predicted nucleic acid-binding protein